MIRCNHCGGVYVGRPQKKRGKKNGESYDLFRYRCNSYVTKGRSVCPSLGLHCEWIEGELVELVRREICSPERLAALQELVRKKIEARRSRYGKDLRELDRRLADIDRRIDNYYRAIDDGLDAKTCREHICRETRRYSEGKSCDCYRSRVCKYPATKTVIALPLGCHSA